MRHADASPPPWPQNPPKRYFAPLRVTPQNICLPPTRQTYDKIQESCRFSALAHQQPLGTCSRCRRITGDQSQTLRGLDRPWPNSYKMIEVYLTLNTNPNPKPRPPRKFLGKIWMDLGPSFDKTVETYLTLNTNPNPKPRPPRKFLGKSWIGLWPSFDKTVETYLTLNTNPNPKPRPPRK
ncbi:unnamed protein product, partial [Laminaria digitata]